MRRLIVIASLALSASPLHAAAMPGGQAGFDAAIAASKAAMMADPAAALQQASEAQALAEAMPAGRAAMLDHATALWLQGEAVTRLQQPQDALPILQRAHDLSVKLDPRAKLTGDILLSRGWAESALGKVQLALADFQGAHGIFRRIGEVRGQAKALQNIGGIYHDAGDDERSLDYYRQVAELSRDDPAIALAAANNLGETLKALGRYDQSEAEYRRALALAAKVGGPALQVGILTNLASAQLKAGKPGAAQATARRALALSRQGAADERPFIYGVLAQIDLKNGRLDEARAMIGETFAGVDLADSPAAFRDFHEAAATIYRRLGENDAAFAHLAAYKRIDDDVRALAASTNAALMAARFDFTNQKVKIGRLETDRLKREREMEHAQARFRTILFSLALAAAGIVAGLLLVGFLKLRRSRNAVRAANGQLSEANVSLEKALKAKSDFLATTSHEIRTPLNGILGMTQVMLADRAVAPEMRGRIEVVHSAGEQMKALVDDILDIAKIETGKLATEAMPFDLARLLADAGRFWRARAELKGIGLELDLAACPRGIESDEARLRQVVFNLMSNAIKFTHQGGVRLVARAEGERLVIVVSDTGIGIPADQCERVFEKFHQVDGGTARQFSGTGLGLAICRSVAEALDGTIVLLSVLGEGSTFTLSLPLVAAEIAAPPIEAGHHAVATLAEATLLLVEANPLTQRVLAKGFRGAVATIEMVADADAAIARLGQGGIDLLLAQAEDAGSMAPLLDAARTVGGRACILFQPGDAVDADRLIAHGATLALAKPIVPSAIVAALAALYDEPTRAAA